MVAPLLEQSTIDPKCVGSNPVGSDNGRNLRKEQIVFWVPSVSKLEIDKMAFGHMDLDQMALGQMALD
jgi:hypothetical protein